MRSLGPEDIMPCWYYDKKEIRSNTPSVRDGIDPDVEARYRKEGTRFITDTGNKMGLRHYETLATGSVYFHRFYMSHSFKQFPRYVTACCCLFLAGKVEETPKKCKDIIKAARSLLNDQQFAQFGEDPKEEVMTLERILLQTMKFDLQVDHPYKYLLRYAKCLKGEKEKLEKMVQMAWTFVNDSLYTTLCLQWEPEIIAIALMYLATKLSKFEVSDWNGKTPKQQRWWDMYVEDISIELLEDVCHQVLDIYSNSAKAESPPPTTPPQSSRHGRVRPAPNNDQQNPSPLLSKKPTLTPPAMPSTVVPQPKTLTMDPAKMDPMMLDPGVPSVQMQSHLMPGQSETSNHISVIHNYKYPVSMTGIPEGFVPPQYVPSPNAPYATFGELQMPGQAMIDGSYSAGYYESGAFPTSYVNTIQPPNTATMPPHYPGAVALHYLTEPPGYAHQGGRPLPNSTAQFASGVYPPTGYPPPHYSSSPVPPVPGRASLHQGLQRGAGASRLTTRQATHSNWGV